MLTETEAQQIAEKFLLAKYFDAKVAFGSNQLITRDDIQLYQLQGKITMRSRGLLDRFTVHKSAHNYIVKIEINAQQGQVLNYEFT